MTWSSDEPTANTSGAGGVDGANGLRIDRVQEAPEVQNTKAMRIAKCANVTKHGRDRRSSFRLEFTRRGGQSAFRIRHAPSRPAVKQLDQPLL
jgi:hypothetical protein